MWTIFLLKTLFSVIKCPLNTDAGNWLPLRTQCLCNVPSCKWTLCSLSPRKIGYRTQYVSHFAFAARKLRNKFSALINTSSVLAIYSYNVLNCFYVFYLSHLTVSVCLTFLNRHTERLKVNQRVVRGNTWKNGPLICLYSDLVAYFLKYEHHSTPPALSWPPSSLI